MTGVANGTITDIVNFNVQSILHGFADLVNAKDQVNCLKNVNNKNHECYYK